jgi:hypothetical protein
VAKLKLFLDASEALFQPCFHIKINPQCTIFYCATTFSSIGERNEKRVRRGWEGGWEGGRVGEWVRRWERRWERKDMKVRGRQPHIEYEALGKP